ncbi:ABC transporter substrate-binding protein [Niallia sp. 01092]|uniref:ABC transporter substrate-binding protein n=1 Tax=unclassified Niallia TaxID=2837522 RepID=UPI003FD3D7CA
MKKLYTYIFALLLAVGVLAGCGETKKGDNAADTKKTDAVSFPVTIKDALDEEVVVDKKPEKIVSLIPSNTEIAFALGLGKEMVGVSNYDNYPPETAKIEKIGDSNFNVEKIISLKPDVVLAHASGAHNSKEGLQQLRDAGIDVIVVNDAANFEGVYDSIAMIGKATGETQAAEKVIAEMKNKIAEIKNKAAKIADKDKKSIYIEISGEPSIYTTGKNTFMQEMLDTINAKNVVTEEGWIQVDQEEIIKANPDVIITTYGIYATENPAETISKRKGWQDITAVKNKSVADVDSDTVTRSGPRLVKGVEEFAKAVYPDVFK